jgi:hypothetical protein
MREREKVECKNFIFAEFSYNKFSRVNEVEVVQHEIIIIHRSLYSLWRVKDKKTSVSLAFVCAKLVSNKGYICLYMI